jgi:effector-binding domain-containing protein
MSLEPSDFAGMNVVYIDVSCTEEEILRVPAVMHAKIISSLPEMDVTMTGPLLVMREGKIGNLLQMKAGIPVSAKPKAALTDGMKIMQLPPGRIMLARMNGLPSVISPAFPEMKKEILKWKLKPSGSPWECYISELNNRKDPLENRMEIYWPVQ